MSAGSTLRSIHQNYALKLKSNETIRLSYQFVENLSYLKTSVIDIQIKSKSNPYYSLSLVILLKSIKSWMTKMKKKRSKPNQTYNKQRKLPCKTECPRQIKPAPTRTNEHDDTLSPSSSTHITSHTSCRNTIIFVKSVNIKFKSVNLN